MKAVLIGLIPRELTAFKKR